MVTETMELITIIAIIAVPAVIFGTILRIMEITEIRRNKINTIERLHDDTKLNTDLNAKSRFMKTLKMLITAKNRHTFKKVAESFTKIAESVQNPLDKAYCLGWAGRCYEDYGDDSRAADCYTKAVTIAPSDIYSAEKLGDFYYGSTSEPNRSEEMYNQILEYDPLEPRAYYKLAKVHSFAESGASLTAIEYYKKAIEADNKYVAPMADAAIEYAKIGDKSNSLKYYFLAMANDVHEFEKLEEAIESCISQ